MSSKFEYIILRLSWQADNKFKFDRSLDKYRTRAVDRNIFLVEYDGKRDRINARGIWPRSPRLTYLLSGSASTGLYLEVEVRFLSEIQLCFFVS